MNKAFSSILIIALCFCTYVFFSWWMRKRYIIDGYKHSGSYKTKNSAYKKNWNCWQRLLLIPFFNSKRKRKYNLLVGLSYFHFFLTIIIIVEHVFREYLGRNGLHWHIGFVLTLLICIIQWIIIEI